MAAKQNRLSELRDPAVQESGHPDGIHDGFSNSFVTTEGAFTPIPPAPIEGTWLWDWETHTWKEVVQPASDTTTSEVKA